MATKERTWIFPLTMGQDMSLTIIGGDLNAKDLEFLDSWFKLITEASQYQDKPVAREDDLEPSGD